MINDTLGEQEASGPLIAFAFFLVLLFWIGSMWLEDPRDDNAAKALVLILVGVLSLLYFLRRRNFLSLIAFTMPFPIYLRFTDRDAFTLTTFLICMLLFTHLDVLPSRLRRLKHSYGSALLLATILFLVILVSFLSTMGGSVGPTLRRLVSEGASFSIFLMCGAVIEDFAALRNLLRALIAAFLVQSCVVTLQVMFPQVAIPVSIFSPRDNPDFVRILNSMSRAGGTLGDYELLAQWFAIITPFALYFVLSDKKNTIFNLFVLASLLGGIVMTGTRGALVSVSIGLVVFLLIILRNESDLPPKK